MLNFEAQIETILMSDATVDQIVLWLSGPRNNATTLEHYEREWLALNNPKVDAALALYGRSPSCLAQLLESSTDLRLVRVIAANPACSTDIKSKILNNKKFSDEQYRVVKLYFFLNPELEPQELIRLVFGYAYSEYPPLAKAEYGAAFELFQIMLDNDPDWVNRYLPQIKYHGLLQFFLWIFVNGSVAETPSLLLTLVGILRRHFFRSDVISELPLSGFSSQINATGDSCDFSLYLPSAQQFENLLSTANQTEDYTSTVCEEFVIEFIELAFEKSTSQQWRNGFKHSKNALMRETFFRRAEVQEIFQYYREIRYVDIDSWSDDSTVFPGFSRLKSEVTLLMNEDFASVSAISFNLSFYLLPQNRAFLKAIGLYDDSSHQKARADSGYHASIREDAGYIDLRNALEDVSNEVAQLKERIRALTK